MEKSCIGTKKSLWKMIKHPQSGATELSNNYAFRESKFCLPPWRRLLLLNKVLPNEILLIIL